MKKIENNDMGINLGKINLSNINNNFAVKNVKKNGEIVDIVDISGNTSKVVSQKYDIKLLEKFNISKSKDLEEMFKAVDNGYEKLNCISDKQVVLVLGNTGSGKSTLVDYLTNKNLIADKPKDSNRKGELHIINEGEVECKIGHNAGKSCTTIPNRDASTSNVYWDCPGFKDTRGFKQDIVNQFYINNIFNKVEDVKVLVVIDEATLDSTRGGIFNELLTTLHHMFENSNKVLEQSCIFVFTKSTCNDLDSLKNELQNGFIDNEKSDLSNETKKILSNVIKSNLVVIFSKPEQKGTVDIQERDYILKILGNASYTSNPTIKLTLASDSLKETISLKREVENEIENSVCVRIKDLFDSSLTKMSDKELSDIAKSYEKLDKLKDEFKNEREFLNFFDKNIFSSCKDYEAIKIELDKIKYFHETVFENFLGKVMPDGERIRGDKLILPLVSNVIIQVIKEKDNRLENEVQESKNKYQNLEMKHSSTMTRTNDLENKNSVLINQNTNLSSKVQKSESKAQACEIQYNKALNEIRSVENQRDVYKQQVAEHIAENRSNESRVNAPDVKNDKGWSTGAKVGTHIGVTAGAGIIGGVIGGTMITTTTVVTAGSAAALAGAEIGSTIGVVGGPVGIAIGAGLGVVVGGVAGLLIWAFK
jgi:hypothetical protein